MNSLRLLLGSILAWAPLSSATIPGFQDYLVTNLWHGPPPALILTKPWERMFQTRLRNAANGPPNFAGHMRVVLWGCGSECIAGAVVDLENAAVLSPPLASTTTNSGRVSFCQSAYEHSGVEYRVDSRLMIVKCGLNYSIRLERNIPDTYYFVLDNNRFRQILRISGEEISRKHLDADH